VLTRHVSSSPAERIVFAKELAKFKDYGVEEASDVWK
jgi:hypothetical protein